MVANPAKTNPVPEGGRKRGPVTITGLGDGTFDGMGVLAEAYANIKANTDRGRGRTPVTVTGLGGTGFDGMGVLANAHANRETNVRGNRS